MRKVRRRLSRFSTQIPSKPISTNNLYCGRKVRSSDYRKYRKEVERFLGDNYKGNVYDLEGNLHLDLEIGYSSPLSDLSNGIKGLEDVLADYLQFNDRQIISINMRKYLVSKGSEYTKVSIRKTRKIYDRRVKYGKKTKAGK